MARRHHKAHRGRRTRRWCCFPARACSLRTTFEDPAELLGDRPRRASARGEPPVDSGRPGRSSTGPLYGVCTHGRHDACCAERGRPVCAALTRPPSGAGLGGLPHRRRPVRGQPAGAARRAVLRARSTRSRCSGWSPGTRPVASTSTGSVDARPCPMPVAVRRDRAASSPGRGPRRRRSTDQPRRRHLRVQPP